MGMRGKWASGNKGQARQQEAGEWERWVGEWER